MLFYIEKRLYLYEKNFHKNNRVITLFLLIIYDIMTTQKEGEKMKKFCFGTIFNLLYYVYKGTKKELYTSIENIVEIKDSDYVNQSSISKRANGKEEFPKYITKKFLDTDINILIENFQIYIVNKLHVDKKELLVLVIKDILKNDNSIPKNRKIGVNPLYTKKKILEMNEFDIAELLANVFIYSISSENKIYAQNIREITKDYVNSFEDKKEEITILYK